MRAGKLRHLLNLEAPTETRDAMGGVVRSFQHQARVWGSVEPLNGNEYFAAQQARASTTHKATIRHRSGVVTGWRITFGTRVFNIESVLSTDERNIDQQLMCREVVPQ